jgi:hypothetical protein
MLVFATFQTIEDKIKNILAPRTGLPIITSDIYATSEADFNQLLLHTDSSTGNKYQRYLSLRLENIIEVDDQVDTYDPVTQLNFLVGVFCQDIRTNPNLAYLTVLQDYLIVREELLKKPTEKNPPFHIGDLTQLGIIERAVSPLMPVSKSQNYVGYIIRGSLPVIVY